MFPTTSPPRVTVSALTQLRVHAAGGSVGRLDADGRLPCGQSRNDFVERELQVGGCCHPDSPGCVVRRTQTLPRRQQGGRDKRQKTDTKHGANLV